MPAVYRKLGTDPTGLAAALGRRRTGPEDHPAG